jgi:hypothetical protein
MSVFLFSVSVGAGHPVPRRVIATLHLLGRHVVASLFGPESRQAFRAMKSRQAFQAMKSRQAFR